MIGSNEKSTPDPRHLRANGLLNAIDAGHSGKAELLAMMGLFGALISIVQLLLVERRAFSHAAWSWQVCSALQDGLT